MVLADNTTVFSKASILQQVIVALQRYIQPSLQPVINLSGTLIHTNLGRSVLPKDTINALINAASSPVNLEYDLAKGARGERDSHLAGLISLLTGAESATFVNNNGRGGVINPEQPGKTAKKSSSHGGNSSKSAVRSGFRIS